MQNGMRFALYNGFNKLYNGWYEIKSVQELLSACAEFDYFCCAR